MEIIKEWWKYDSEYERASVRYSLKAGPKKDHHRIECCCVECCGSELAEQIVRFHDNTLWGARGT